MADASNTDRLHERLAEALKGLSTLKDKVGSIDGELIRTARAIEDSTRVIASAIAELQTHVTSGADRVQNSVRETTAIIGVANTSIEAAHKSNKELLGTQTSAIVQFELVRTYNDAFTLKATQDILTKDIDARFTKTLESAMLNRVLYDRHFNAIHDDFDKKMRVIGSHIYSIWEEDLRPLESANQITASSLQELNLQVDMEHMALRSEQLEQDLEYLNNEVLEPKFGLEQAFENKLAVTFAMPDSDGSKQAFEVPVVCLRVAGRTDVHFDSHVHNDPVSGDPVITPSSRAIDSGFSSRAIDPGARSVETAIHRAMDNARTHEFTAADRSRLHIALQQLADLKLIPPDRVASLVELARISDLRLLSSQEIVQ